MIVVDNGVVMSSAIAAAAALADSLRTIFAEWLRVKHEEGRIHCQWE